MPEHELLEKQPALITYVPVVGATMEILESRPHVLVSSLLAISTPEGFLSRRYVSPLPEAPGRPQVPTVNSVPAVRKTADCVVFAVALLVLEAE